MPVSLISSKPQPTTAVIRLDRRKVLLLSPMALIAMGQLFAWSVSPWRSKWAWAYLFSGYWITLGGLILWGGGKEAVVRWLRRSQGGIFWPSIAVTFALLSTLWMAIPNWRFFLRTEIILPGLFFTLINPFLEEGYWRGLIIDAAVRWPQWLAILYSGFLSATNHLFVMVVVPAARNPAVWAYQFVLGLLMGIVYNRTKSLRWVIVSHAIVNMLSLTTAMFLGLYIPGLPGQGVDA